MNVEGDLATRTPFAKILGEVLFVNARKASLEMVSNAKVLVLFNCQVYYVKGFATSNV